MGDGRLHQQANICRETESVLSFPFSNKHVLSVTKTPIKKDSWYFF